MKKESLRVGIIGCGFVSRFNVKAWEFLGHKVVAVCDLNKFLADQLALVTRANSYTDFMKMLEAENLDAVSVCTPPSSHYFLLQGVTSFSHKIKVVVEKPFMLKSKNANDFWLSKRVAVLHTQLYSSCYFEALKLVKEGLVGKVFEVNVNLLATPKDYMTVDPKNWSHKLRGGRIAECLSHPVYLAQSFLGQNNLFVKETRAFKPYLNSLKHLSYSELFAVLEGTRCRATLNVRLNMPRTVATVDVVGALGVLKAGIVPEILQVHFFKGKSKSFKKSKFMYPRVRIIEELLVGDCPVTGDHAFNNVKIVEAMVDKILESKSRGV